MPALSHRQSSALAFSPQRWAHAFDATSIGAAAREFGKALLADAGPAGIAVLSRGNLEHLRGRKRTSVRRGLRALEAAGLVERTQRFDRHGGADRNGYRLTLPHKGGRS